MNPNLEQLKFFCHNLMSYREKNPYDFMFLSILSIEQHRFDTLNLFIHVMKYLLSSTKKFLIDNN